jgi:hypothetical protein
VLRTLDAPEMFEPHWLKRIVKHAATNVSEQNVDTGSKLGILPGINSFCTKGVLLGFSGYLLHASRSCSMRASGAKTHPETTSGVYIGVRSTSGYFFSFNITSSASACGLSRHWSIKASVCFSSISTLNFESPDFPSR